MNQYGGRGNWGSDYDMFGNPINVGVYGVNEHQMMHQPGMMNGVPHCMPNGMPYSQMGVPSPQMQMGMYPQAGMYPHHRRTTTKKDILEYVKNFACPSEVEQVSEFDTIKTRHICRGFKEIVLLDKQSIQVPTSNGAVNVEVFFCPRCRKLLINSQSLEIL